MAGPGHCGRGHRQYADPKPGQITFVANTVDYWWRRRSGPLGCVVSGSTTWHFYASRLIAAGCDVVTVQRSLGHAKATTTLNTNAHLWPTAEDRTRTATQSIMDAALGDEDRNHNWKIGLYVGARESQTGSHRKALPSGTLGVIAQNDATLPS